VSERERERERKREREREGDREKGREYWQMETALAREFMDSWISRETPEVLRVVWDS